MKISVITPCRNSGRFLETTVKSIISQRATAGVEIEYIVVDGASTDNTPEILAKYAKDIDKVVSEPDKGPADAINKGFRLATGDIICWLNADDTYEPDAIRRLVECVNKKPGRGIYFGKCRIVNLDGKEIRKGITHFKNAFFPFSCRPMIQTINYVSQPASFFSREAVEKAGLLRIDLKAAFDYEYILRLWKNGGGAVIPGGAVSNFRWYPGSISGQTFKRQFKEELDAAIADAGKWSIQAFLHRFVRFGIVSIYSLMAKRNDG